MKCASASSSLATSSTRRVTSAARAANSRRVSSSTIPPSATIVSSMSARSPSALGNRRTIESTMRRFHRSLSRAKSALNAGSSSEASRRQRINPALARAMVTQRRFAAKIVWYGVSVPPSRGAAMNRSRNSPSTSMVSACLPSK
jgi:hypothetical protein